MTEREWKESDGCPRCGGIIEDCDITDATSFGENGFGGTQNICFTYECRSCGQEFPIWEEWQFVRSIFNDED